MTGDPEPLRYSSGSLRFGRVLMFVFWSGIAVGAVVGVLVAPGALSKTLCGLAVGVASVLAVRGLFVGVSVTKSEIVRRTIGWTKRIPTAEVEDIVLGSGRAMTPTVAPVVVLRSGKRVVLQPAAASVYGAGADQVRTFVESARRRVGLPETAS